MFCIIPESDAERDNYSDGILVRRLRSAIARLNQHIPHGSREEAFKKVVRAESQDLIYSNQSFHDMLVNGVDVEYRNDEGEVVYDKVWLFDFKHNDNNEYLAVNQFLKAISLEFQKC